MNSMSTHMIMLIFDFSVKIFILNHYFKKFKIFVNLFLKNFNFEFITLGFDRKTSIPKIFNFEKIEVFIIIMWPKFFQRSPSRDDFISYNVAVDHFSFS